MLDLVGVALNINGFQFQRVDGSRTDEQRRFSLNAFRTDHRYSILLASIGTAGIGYFTACHPSPQSTLSEQVH